jgi:hypothetical protein
VSVPNYSYDPYGSPPPGPARPRGTNGLAVASLVLGLLWLCWLGSVAAVILGHIALSQIKRTGQAGRGIAIAGLVLGYLGVLTAIGAGALTLTVGKEATKDKQATILLEANGSGGAAQANVTYSIGKIDPTQQMGSSLPWRRESSEKLNGFDVVTLHVQNTGTSGDVSCRITVNGSVVKENTANGPYAIASCTYNRLAD